MREYDNYPTRIENNSIIPTEVKKPKFYLVTSKIMNLFAVFVATISVSTFFATRYISLGDILFPANLLSTMLAVSLLITILEIYGKKNALKAFMCGAYAILLVFFISAFIVDFNPVPIDYYQSSFVNFHQVVLLSVFISYIISFLACIKIYLYTKEKLNMPYLWAKSLPAIAISQVIYAVCYNFIYYGFSNFDIISIAIKNELYLKLCMTILSILVIYFIVSGIKSGFFDLAKSIVSKNINDYEYISKPMKPVYEENYDRSIPQYDYYSNNNYRQERTIRKPKRELPDYSNNGNYYNTTKLPSMNHHNEEENYNNQQSFADERSRSRRGRNTRTGQAPRRQTSPNIIRNIQSETHNNNINSRRTQAQVNQQNMQERQTQSRMQNRPIVPNIRDNSNGNNNRIVNSQNSQNNNMFGMRNNPNPDFGNGFATSNNTKNNNAFNNQKNQFSNNNFANSNPQQPNSQGFFMNKLQQTNPFANPSGMSKNPFGNSNINTPNMSNVNRNNQWNKR